VLLIHVTENCVGQGDHHKSELHHCTHHHHGAKKSQKIVFWLESGETASVLQKGYNVKRAT